jgi:hypothetical protein
MQASRKPCGRVRSADSGELEMKWRILAIGCRMMDQTAISGIVLEE